jgi:hypothetical protein
MNDLPAKVNPDSHRFHFNVTYYKEVLGVFKSISALKAAGLDNIPLKLIKDAAEELAMPLTTLVNRSLTCGLFPTAEKAAKISPINKSEDKTALDNYRPISVMPVFSKVLERVVYNRLSYYLEENNLLNDSKSNVCYSWKSVPQHDSAYSNIFPQLFTCDFQTTR